MPDGETSNQPAGTEPVPPADQIQVEISTGRVAEWLGGLFGTDQEITAGGGGTGGQFMFASIAELDAVIAQWKDQREAIAQDANQIRQAATFANPPAGDTMSGGIADATSRSIEALFKHNHEMWKYADDYVRKLEASRASMVNTDQSGQAAMNSVNQGLG